MNLEKYYNKKKKEHYLFFKEALFIDLVYKSGGFGRHYKIGKYQENFLPFDQKGLKNFFFQEFLENFFHHYYKDEDKTIITYTMLNIKMHALVTSFSACIFSQNMEEMGEAAYDDDVDIDNGNFTCFFEIDELYKPAAHLITKKKFKDILNFLGKKVVLKDEYSFKIEFFFKEEEPFKEAELWEPTNPEIFNERYPTAENCASDPELYIRNVQNCNFMLMPFTFPKEIKEEVLKMLNNP